MLPILLTAAQTAYSTSCVFGGTPAGAGSLNTNNWIQINLIVVLLSFTLAALVYSLSGLFPASMGEKMKGAAKYEAFQGVVSISIILILVAFASLTCNMGRVLVSSSAPVTQTAYSDPMQFAQSYIGNLMFSTGLGLFSQIYSESVIMAISANLASVVEEHLTDLVINPFFSISISPDIIGTLFGFSGALSSSFEPLIVVTFGILFMIYLLLPIITALALTVVVPLALIMRSIPFAGPKLRESSDTFMSLAIGFYFILPLAILMNSYIISWTSCTGISLQCNPYSQFNTQYQLASIPKSQFFNQPPQSISPTSTSPISTLAVPFSFFSSSVAQDGGLKSSIIQILTIMFDIPSVIILYAAKTAQYVFEGIVLIGIDMAIVLAFAQGLTKGLNSAGKMIGTGPFWGNV